MKKSKTAQIFIPLFLLFLLPVSIFLALDRQEIRKQATSQTNAQHNILQASIQQPSTLNPTPEYAPGEILVKFKKQAIIKSSELDKKPVSIQSLRTSSENRLLARFLKQQGITKLEKVFKGAKSPKTETSEFQSKFSARKISSQKARKIDLSRTYKLTVNKSTDIPIKVQELAQNPY